jgi:outer membrane protein TolC
LFVLRRHLPGILATISLFVASNLFAEQQLPERLTLEHALSLVEKSQHPDLERAQAGIEQAQAGKLAADSLTGTDVKIIGQLRYVEPNSVIPDRSHDDSQLGLYVSKPLYDFGRSEARVSAAEADIRAQQSAYLGAYNAQRIEVMQRFFDVILADHEYLRDNEDMASRYVRMDKARDRAKLGQVSEIEVLRLETIYQQARLNRYRSESRQRATRAKLATALNMPDKLPGEVVRPLLPSLTREIPDEVELQKIALQNNQALITSHAEVKAAQARIDAARAGDNPVLRADAEAVSYSREIGARDDARIGLTLEVPLFSGGRDDAAIAAARAELRRSRANEAAIEGKILQAVLDAALDVRTLRAQLEQAKVQTQWSERNLDLNRSRYEMEQQATLGDAMIEIAKSELFKAKTEFELELTWARLDALMGKTVFYYNTPESSRPATTSRTEP